MEGWFAVPGRDGTGRDDNVFHLKQEFHAFWIQYFYPIQSFLIVLYIIDSFKCSLLYVLYIFYCIYFIYPKINYDTMNFRDTSHTVYSFMWTLTSSYLNFITSYFLSISRQSQLFLFGFIYIRNATQAVLSWSPWLLRFIVQQIRLPCMVIQFLIFYLLFFAWSF